MALLTIVWLFVGAPEAFAESSSRNSPVVQAVRDCSPAVVNIQGQKSINELPDGTPSSPRQVNGMGTGVVIDPRGYILTNHHVVDGVRRINVTLDTGHAYIAKLVAHDKETDLAVIRIRTPKPMTVIRLGSSHDLLPGETVIAVGNSFGYEHTVTLGIISALHRNVQVNETQRYLDLIQTDASINPGNSGGPLLNVDGEMIGLNVAVRAGAQGIGFAIPINKALDVATELISIERLDNHWHGMTVVTSDAAFGGPVTLASVDGGSPAQRCGLERGDQIERIGSTSIHRAIDIERALLGRGSGERVPVVVRRNDQEVQLDLMVASLASGSSGQTNSTAAEPLQEATWETLGLQLESVPGELLGDSESSYEGGMRVVSVRPDSSAANQGVRRGDILVRIHRWTITSDRDVQFVVDRADTLARMGAVKFYILRGDKPFFGHLAVNARTTQRR